MKKSVLIFLAAVSVVMTVPCLVSCNNDDAEEEEVVKKPTIPQKPKPEAGVYKFTASALKGTWEVGDKIQVRGSYGPGAVVITLTADDIKDGGKTATAVLGEELMSHVVAPDWLYAAYPADAVRAQGGSTDADVTFEKYDQLVAVAYLDGDTFEFHDASALISFSVSGDYDCYAFAGSMRPGLTYIKNFNITFSSLDQIFTRPANDGYPFVYGDLKGETINLWFPAGITFTDGFTVYAGKDGEWPKAFTEKSTVSLKAGQSKVYGDLADKLEDYTGPAPKMPTMGDVSKLTVEVNELSGICVHTDATFLWVIDDNGKIAKVDFEGNISDYRSISGDPEGITIEEETKDLIIANEPNFVTRIKAEGGYTGNAKTVFSIKEASGYGNSGMEGITYYKKDGDKSLVYCGTQTGAHLYLCDLNGPLTGGYTTVLEMYPLRSMFPSILEIAGLCYDPLTDWLWVVDSEAHKIFVLSGDAQHLLSAYALKSKSNEESICVDHVHKCVWIGDDAGSPSYIFRYEFPDLDDFVINK